MKKLIAIMAVLFANTALADQYVSGHFKQNGTYVEPYHRSSPNSTTYDNYSTRGNTNPYTGQAGAVIPGYQAPYTPPQPSIYNPYDYRR